MRRDTTCLKPAYATEAAAVQADAVYARARQVVGRRRRPFKPAHPYRCPKCRKWHLTTQPVTR